MIIAAHVAVLIFVIALVALCLGWVCGFDTWSDLLMETAGNMAVLYFFFLLRFHIVHRDGSDPSFSSITQRFSSEHQSVPRGPNAHEKVPQWSKSAQENGPLRALPFSA